MQQKEIVNRLSRITANSSETICSVTMKNVLTPVVGRFGHLSVDDLELVREEDHITT
jgi:hypothetical protein